MDNIELITVLSDYAIFCIDRQETMLKVYRKRQRSYWQVFIDAFIATMAFAGIIAAIWCAAIEYVDGWLAVLLTVLYVIAIAIFVTDCKATCELITSYNRYLKQASSIPAALNDVASIVDYVNGEYTSNDTEEEEQ